jgi:pullulanase/glycogen debranching enzyme
LDVSTNTALISLNCSWNQLTSLDVSATTALTDLVCFSNQLTSLNVSANTALTSLSCGGNQLTSLDVSSNTALTDLQCDGNPLMNLDVSANTALTFLSCSDIQITSLDVSANTALTFLNCHDNQLTSLDFSANTALTSLYCYSNQLTSLNVQNGYNTNFTILHAINNPNLTCIQVDNVAYSNAHWSNGKDATASFSTNCGAVSVPDIGNLATVQIVPNPANGYVTINGFNDIQKIELINLQGQIIKTILVNGNSSSIDVSGIANGIYHLKLSSSNQSKTERLVVVH